MSVGRIITYDHFLNGIFYNPKEADARQVELLLNKAKDSHQFIYSNPLRGVTHIIDYKKRNHVCIGGDYKHFLGYEVEAILESGLPLMINNFQKDDYKVFNANIFPKIAEFLKSTPHEYHGNYIFSFSYRTTRSNGELMYINQQNSYITCPITKLPLYCVGLVTDISNFMTGHYLHLSIEEKICNRNSFFYKQIVSDYYYPYPEEAQLSDREKEILGRISQGLSSKEIAAKLYISESTVVNHRKNILRKTNTKNVAELITFAVKNRLI